VGVAAVVRLMSVMAVLFSLDLAGVGGGSDRTSIDFHHLQTVPYSLLLSGRGLP